MKRIIKDLYLSRISNSRNRFKSNLGLSLIEIMVVVTIIALLLIIAYFVYKTQISKAKDAKKKSDIYDLKTAVENYEKDRDCYPAGIPACVPGDGFKPYIQKIPCDPTTRDNYHYYPDPYHPVCPRWYWIFVDLDYDRDPVIESLGCTYGCGPKLDETWYDYYQTSPNAPEPIKAEEPTPSGGPVPTGPSGYFGCFSGVCQPIYWGDDWCHPNYPFEDCGGYCDYPENECTVVNP